MFVFISDMSVLGLRGIGPKKEKILVEHGYDTRDKLMNADFYDIMALPGFGYIITCNIWALLGRDLDYPNMIEITETTDEDVIIENKKIVPWRQYKKTKTYAAQPPEYKLQKTTVWSFPERGEWASHTPQYRGNWSPWIVRNIIERYSEPGDTVLDPMVGGGTTPVECKLLGRNSISVDINPGAIQITRDRLNFPVDGNGMQPETKHKTYVGDVRNLDLIADESIDLIATHPPYANIIKYAPCINGDLSQITDYRLFFREYNKAIKEMFRVLKPGSYCAILIGDTHNKSHYVPISAKMMLDYLESGFILKEDIIKKEWNCESDRHLAKYSNADFLLTMHEHLFIFEKPKNNTANLKNSSIEFFKP